MALLRKDTFVSGLAGGQWVLYLVMPSKSVEQFMFELFIFIKFKILGSFRASIDFRRQLGRDPKRFDVQPLIRAELTCLAGGTGTFGS